MSRRKTKTVRRRARWEVAMGIGVFLVLQGLLALAVEVWFPAWREPMLTPRVEHYLARADAVGERGRTVLFLGSSRFRHGIHTKILERELADLVRTPVAVFNYSRNGATYLTSHRQWRRLRTAGAHPSLAVVDLVPVQLHVDYPRVDVSLTTAPAGEQGARPCRDTTRRNRAE